MKMDCKTTQSLVIPYIKGELTEEQEEAFLCHVFECRECFEELEIFYTVYEALQKLDEEDHVSYNMQELLSVSLRAAQRKIIWHKLVHYFSYALMIAAEAVLACMLIGGQVEIHFSRKAETWQMIETETETGKASETQKAETETAVPKETAAQTQAKTDTKIERKTEGSHE